MHPERVLFCVYAALTISGLSLLVASTFMARSDLTKWSLVVLGAAVAVVAVPAVIALCHIALTSRKR